MPACMYIGEFAIKELSVWLVVDLGTVQGQEMALEAINFIVSYVGYSWAASLSGDFFR